MSDNSSTSESEVSACSANFDPLKTLYSNKAKVPVKNAPMYNTVDQYEASLASKNTIVPVGCSELVRKINEEKERKKQEEARELEEKNRRRFAQYEG